jgi:C4-dicarboxylate transporter DctM subunit
MAHFIYFGLPAILMMLGFPIFAVLVLTSLAAILFVADVPTTAIPTYMFGSLDNFAARGALFRARRRDHVAGRHRARGRLGGIDHRCIRGSLAITTVAELFGAVVAPSACGGGRPPALSSLKTTAGNELQRRPDRLLGRGRGDHPAVDLDDPLLMTAQQSALLLFTAGILPSILIGVVDAAYVFAYSRIKMVPLPGARTWVNIWESTKEASWAIGTIVVIFGGIYGGTSRRPRPPAAVITRCSSPPSSTATRPADLWRVVLNSAFLISQILIIVAAVDLPWLLTTSGIPSRSSAASRRSRCGQGDAALINIGP